MEVFDPAHAHFNKRCTSISSSPVDPARLRVNFLDGTSHDADVVLGADGIRSTVRDYVLGTKENRVQFSNTFAYCGLVPAVHLREAGCRIDASEHPACICGPSKVRILSICLSHTDDIPPVRS